MIDTDLFRNVYPRPHFAKSIQHLEVGSAHYCVTISESHRNATMIAAILTHTTLAYDSFGAC